MNLGTNNTLSMGGEIVGALQVKAVSGCGHCGGCDNCNRCSHCGRCKNCGKAVELYPYQYGPYGGTLPYVPYQPTWISTPQITYTAGACTTAVPSGGTYHGPG